MTDVELARARADAEAKKEALLATAHEVQARLRIGTLAENAFDHLKRKGEAQARKRPATVALAAAGVAGLIVAGPLVKLARWAAGRRNQDGDRE